MKLYKEAKSILYVFHPITQLYMVFRMLIPENNKTTRDALLQKIAAIALGFGTLFYGIAELLKVLRM